jgi:cell division protein FtsQ
MSQVAKFILRDPFWNAQVSQIDILPDRTFEMIPVVGDHRVRLGNGEQVAAKFHRLQVFYQQVLKRTGMNAYRVIDVRYKGQVVASREDKAGRVDSVRLRKNVERMLKPVKPPPSIIQARPEQADESKDQDPNPVKTTSVSPGAKEESGNMTGNQGKSDEKKRVPKAVMPPRKPAEGTDQKEQ